MPHRPFRPGTAALVALAAAALAGCTDTGGGGDDRGGRGGSGSDDVLGGVLGSAGGKDLLNGVLGGVLGQRVRYRCADRRGFSATFDPIAGGASVEAEGQSYRLQQRTEGGQGGYGAPREYEDENGDVRLTVDGSTAELSVRGEDAIDLKDCRAAATAAATPTGSGRGRDGPPPQDGSNDRDRDRDDDRGGDIEVPAPP